MPLNFEFRPGWPSTVSILGPSDWFGMPAIIVSHKRDVERHTSAGAVLEGSITEQPFRTFIIVSRATLAQVH